MADDLSDIYAELREMKRQLRILQVATPLQNSSISRGSLRVASAEGLIVEGSQRVSGTLLVTGTEEVDGLLRVTGTLITDGNVQINGPTQITGNTDIDGDTTVNGQMDINGPMSINGDTDVTGQMNVTGPMNIQGATVITGTFTIDGQTTINGKTNVVGDMDIKGALTIDGVTKLLKDLVVEGAGKIILKGTTDAILQNGEITLGNGAKLQVGLTGGTSSIGLVPNGGAVDISANSSFAWLRAIGSSVVASTSTVKLDSAVTLIESLPEATSLDDLEWVARKKSNGRLYRVPPGTGGPGGGDFEWPFDLSMVSSEYGMRVHPVTGEEKLHAGIDFGAPGGAPIKSIGSGTVTRSEDSGGFGNLVVVDHGTASGDQVESYYAHMVEPGIPVGSIVTNQTVLGNVGTTGLSSGEHLHMEIHVNGVAVNPRDFMAAHGN